MQCDDYFIGNPQTFKIIPSISFINCIESESAEMIELAHEVHPFFIAGQFHPELKSRATKAHPLFREFVKASLLYHESKAKKKK